MTTRLDGRIRADAITDVERPWIEALEQAGVVAVRDELVAQGVTAATAAGVALFLSDQADRRRVSSKVTAYRYRQLLGDLEPPKARAKVLRTIPGYRDSARAA